jgi:hypothetical protein
MLLDALLADSLDGAPRLDPVELGFELKRCGEKRDLFTCGGALIQLQ